MFKKVDATTYEASSGFFVEKMQDGTWTAYQPIGETDRYIWKWSSRQHRTRQSAYQAISAHRRSNKMKGGLLTMTKTQS